MVTDEYQLIEFFGPLNSDVSVLVRHVQSGELHVVHILAGADDETNQRLMEAAASLPPDQARYHIGTSRYRKIPVMITHPLPAGATAREWLQQYLPPLPFPKVEHMIHTAVAGYQAPRREVTAPSPAEKAVPGTSRPAPPETAPDPVVSQPTGEFTKMLRAAGLAEQGPPSSVSADQLKASPPAAANPAQKQPPARPEQDVAPVDNRAQVFQIPQMTDLLATPPTRPARSPLEDDSIITGGMNRHEPDAHPKAEPESPHGAGEFTQLLQKSGGAQAAAAGSLRARSFQAARDSWADPRPPITQKGPAEPGGFTRMMDVNSGYEPTPRRAAEMPSVDAGFPLLDGEPQPSSQATKVFSPRSEPRTEPAPYNRAERSMGDYTTTIQAPPAADDCAPLAPEPASRPKAGRQSTMLFWICGSILVAAVIAVLIVLILS